jgi:2-(3-amino-3-carboxypropyl)histidine synthase
LLQLPEGLKNYGSALGRHIREKTGTIVYVSADPCYGGCDIPTVESRTLGIDLLIHYGHSPFATENPENLIYVEARAYAEIDGAVEKAIPLLKNYWRIGLVSTVQHVHKLDEVRQILTRKGKEVEVGKAGGRSKYAGQVLGCDYTTAKDVLNRVDAFLHIGGGVFHPIGVVVATGKPVVVADPYTNGASDMTARGMKALKQRRAKMAKVVEARRLGVIVGLKPGQLNFKLAEDLKAKLETAGKDVTLLCLREITPETLNNFIDLEAFVNTACPRIGVDDSQVFRKPIITASEALEIL